MKKRKTMMIMLTAVMLLCHQRVSAQIAVLEIIKAGVKKVIKAVDLKIQREQNKVIWLQNAQKTLENTMSKLKLGEITDWVDRQRNLYRGYYEELAKVKSLITYYQRIREVIDKQVRMVSEYQQAYGLFRQDRRFTAAEIEYMGKVYAGMLDHSLSNIDQIASILKALTTTMTDAKRLELINRAADQVDQTYTDLHQFTTQNKMLSLQRGRSEAEIKTIKELYNIQ